MNHELLARQIALQTRAAWDIDHDIPWDLGVDVNKGFLPLDEQAIAFPGASREQSLALSQYFGLVLNATISEMEDSLPKMRQSGWQRLLQDYPAGPELETLGELFFEEEAKHARAFNRYLNAFCDATGVDFDDLDALLPKAFGSNFQRAITANALSGGHAFWWVVEQVEEVSIGIYAGIYRERAHIDPLFYNLHRRHLEEEARHANYAFLMLELAGRTRPTWRTKLHRKADFLLSQVAGGPWVITELYKFMRVKHLRGTHPFFDTLASCIPLFESMSKPELVRRMFFAAPYVSWLLNPSWRHNHRAICEKHGAFVPPVPAPEVPKLRVVGDD